MNIPLGLQKYLDRIFLIDQNVVEKMMKVIKSLDYETIIEVGPGLGSLTNKLVKLKNSYKSDRNR